MQDADTTHDTSIPTVVSETKSQLRKCMYWRIANYILPTNLEFKSVIYDEESNQIGLAVTKEDKTDCLKFIPNYAYVDAILEYCLEFLQNPEEFNQKWDPKWMNMNQKYDSEDNTDTIE